MFFKKLESFFTFITFAFLTLSSPIIIDEEKESIQLITPTNSLQPITDGLSIIEVRGSYDLISILVSCDNYVVDKECISNMLSALGSSNSTQYTIKAEGMKGSTFSVPKKNGDGYYVGRNLDLNKDSQNLILVNYPEGRYSSISTVNLDFIKQVSGDDNINANHDILTLAPIFATLDGLNERGVSVSINMKEGEVLKNENNYMKYNAVASYLVHIILDAAYDVNKAIDVLRSIEIHNEFDFNIHFMISDATGRSVAVEYKLDEQGASRINVTETSVLTNFSISSGEKSGLGIEQYNTINEKKSASPSMNAEDVKETLEAVKGDTQCSIIYDLNNREAIYYVRENYQQGYRVKFDQNIGDTFPPNPEDENDYEVIDVHVEKYMQRIGDTTYKTVEYEGDYGFDEFLAQGGAKTELDIVQYVLGRTGINLPLMNNNVEGVEFQTPINACSAFSVQNENQDGYYFGRNYDWLNGTALTVVTRPENGYASISTIDTNMINMFVSGKSWDELLASSHEETVVNFELPDEIMKEIAVFVPFDGINEKGFSISMNMVNYLIPIEQNDEGKTHLTITTLIRYLLDKVATVDEAIEVIKNKINMHNSFVHFVIADATGKSAVIEFKTDENGTEVFVVDIPLATNFFVADDYKLQESNYDFIGNDVRYEKILDRLTKKPTHNEKDVRNTLRAGSAYDTAWSIIFDQNNLEATYFIKNEFNVGYRIKLFEDIKEELTDEESTLINGGEEDLPTEVTDIEDFIDQESSSDEENEDEETVIGENY